MKRLQEVWLHNKTPAVGLNTAALHLQLLQQGAPPPLTYNTTTQDSHKTYTNTHQQNTHNTHKDTHTQHNRLYDELHDLKNMLIFFMMTLLIYY